MGACFTALVLALHVRCVSELVSFGLEKRMCTLGPRGLWLLLSPTGPLCVGVGRVPGHGTCASTHTGETWPLQLGVTQALFLKAFPSMAAFPCVPSTCGSGPHAFLGHVSSQGAAGTECAG